MDNGMKIPEYQLFIHPLDLRELRNDIWCDDPVAAKLTLNKKKYDIDIAYRGSHIRDFRKKSYHVSFYKPSTYRNAKEVHINAEYKDPSLLRNKLSLDFFNEIGCLSPKSRFVFLKLNGKNEGLYLELESVDEFFLANRQLPKGPIFYAVDGDANFSLMSDLDKEVKKSLEFGYEKKIGTAQDEYNLQEMIIKINTISREEFEREIVKYLNVDKYLRWLAGVVFTQNFDGFVHNYALYQNGDTGLFEVIPWDYDATWGRDVNGEVMDEDYLRIEGFNTLTARILDVKTFRGQYKNLLKGILSNQFNLEYMKPKIQGMHDLIRPYIQKDSYVKDNIHIFDKEPDYIFDYIEARANYISNRLDTLD
ncbi:CotH kinase family protein [Domibacillus aminovorans]|uniref:Spore coat protein n=1 Tax=Domibacillus aminovorans TaxID=29332 RepID=A0A177L6B2_9BACI|nr:CotH kinase family protein [Domibacillus aminovorans]OAH60842.1 spore coat protein [Domibacillus aminovorans]